MEINETEWSGNKDLEPCRKCGSRPILSRRIFKVDTGEMRVSASGRHVKKISYVPMAYIHCECGYCTTDWESADKGANGTWIPGSEIRKAESAWRKRKWVSIEENEMED